MARQRQQQQTETQTGYQSVESSDGVTFSAGNMMVNGVAQVPTKVEHWESSNGLTNYSTVEWQHPVDQTKRCSCNCPGWAMKKPGKPRSCKHTKDMTGEKACSAKRVDTVTITTIAQAEEHVPKFEGRELRGIMLD